MSVAIVTLGLLSLCPLGALGLMYLFKIEQKDGEV